SKRARSSSFRDRRARRRARVQAEPAWRASWWQRAPAPPPSATRRALGPQSTASSHFAEVCLSAQLIAKRVAPGRPKATRGGPSGGTRRAERDSEKRFNQGRRAGGRDHAPRGPPGWARRYVAPLAADFRA